MSDTYSLADVRKMEQGEDAEAFTLADVRKMQGGKGERGGITDTNGRAMTVGGPMATAFKVAEAMGTPEGRSAAANFLVGGPLAGVAGIGNTILGGKAWLEDKLYEAVRGERTGEESPAKAGQREREKSTADFFRENFSPDSLPFQTTKVGTQVGGTAGAGPFLATAGRTAPITAPAYRAFMGALESGGLRTGVQGLPRLADAGIRIAGGGTAGLASAGLIDPSTALTGAAVGAALPPVLQGFGAAGRAAKTAYATRGNVGMARDVAELAGVNPANVSELEALRDALRRQGPSLIPGEELTIPQMLLTPGTSQAQRSVRAAAPAGFAEREAQQQAARMAALERVAPTYESLPEAADVVGNRISAYANSEREAARRGVRAKFESVDPFNQSKVLLPINEMQAAKDRFLGPGSFGSGGSAHQAINEAERIGADVLPAANQAQGVERALKPVTFEELQNLRSSIGEQWRAANRQGNAKEAAALISQQRAIDKALDNLAAGNGQPGEYFGADMVGTYKEARQAHAAKKLRFDTGPQSSMFRRGGDGELMAQGGEIPRKFFNNRGSQIEDAQAFARLVANDPRMVAELKRYATTEAAGSVDRMGNLTNAKFNRWLDSRSGALGVTFNEQERAMLKAIAESLRRADEAESLARSSGSDTAQKLASMTKLGLLENPAMGYLADKIPGGRAVVGALANRAREGKAEKLGGLLLDPLETAGLLDTYIATQRPPVQGLLSQTVSPALYRTAPGLLTR